MCVLQSRSPSCSLPLLLSTQGFCTSGHCTSTPWLPKFPVLHFSPLINDSSQLATCATGEVLFFWSCNATGIFIIHMISHRVSKWFLIILQHVPESQNSVLFNLCHYHHAYFCSLHLQSNLRLYFLVSEQCSSFRCSPSFPASVGPYIKYNDMLHPHLLTKSKFCHRVNNSFNTKIQLNSV